MQRVFYRIGKYAYSDVQSNRDFLSINQWRVRRLFWRFFVVTGVVA